MEQVNWNLMVCLHQHSHDSHSLLYLHEKSKQHHKIHNTVIPLRADKATIITIKIQLQTLNLKENNIKLKEKHLIKIKTHHKIHKHSKSIARRQSSP